MVELHPQILRKDGRRQFVVIPYDEFEAMREKLEDMEDLIILREARDADTDEPSLSQEEMEREFGLHDSSGNDQSSSDSEAS